ncbi:MAG: replicative DNA helicase [Candidatus Taylorbacteria bacterium]|nr:replicative DNA helicase [Candidatus Taylorbacteria bacterium]
MPEKSLLTSILRVPPQNIEAEQALLGGILIRSEVIHDVIDFINEKSFYSDKHRIIWEGCVELMKRCAPIDLLSLSTELRERGLLERAGGSSYLSELVALVPSVANIANYAHIIHKKYMLRSLINAANEISEIGWSESGELEDILDRAEKRIFELTNSPGTHKFVELKDTLAEAWERLDRLHKTSHELRGVPTGFKELDNRLAGLQKSDLIILAARPSMGKTSLALDIARKAAVQSGIPVGIFSLEMSSQQLVDRMLSAESQVDSWKLRTGHNLSIEHDFQRIRDAMDKLSAAPIYIDDQPGNNIIRMRSVARRLKSDKGLSLIVVDYLQLMSAVYTRNSDSMVQQVTEISRSLKNLARELDVPVLALSQLSRAVESRGGAPRLSDLRDSGSIEQDADVVMFIHREDKYNKESDRPNIAKIMIEKHRNGPTGSVELYFDEKRTTFLSLEKGEFTGL